MMKYGMIKEIEYTEKELEEMEKNIKYDIIPF